MKRLTMFITFIVIMSTPAFAVKTSNCIERFSTAMTDFTFLDVVNMSHEDAFWDGGPFEYFYPEKQSEGYADLTKEKTVALEFVITEKKNAKCYYESFKNVNGSRIYARIEGSDNNPELVVTWGDVKFFMSLASYDKTGISLTKGSRVRISSLEKFEAWEDFDYKWVHIGWVNYENVFFNTLDGVCNLDIAAWEAAQTMYDDVYTYGSADGLSIEKSEWQDTDHGIASFDVVIHAKYTEEGPIDFEQQYHVDLATCTVEYAL